MRLLAVHPFPRRFLLGLTLVEVMIAIGLGSLVMAAVGSLTMYGARTSVAVMNYSDLDAKSRCALDLISRDLRQATAVLNYQTNLPVKSLSLTNADQLTTLTLTWDSAARTVTMQKSDQPGVTVTNLTECDSWDFQFYQRTPWVSGTNITYFPATNITGSVDTSLCKLIALTWKCSRSILGNKLNTESVQAAQIVLRNKR
jgi:hypothetical protein